jgi:outer membrane protein insertion porin family
MDPAQTGNDLKKLKSLGVFDDVAVESRDVEAGKIDIVYKVREYPLISSFSLEGIEDGDAERVHKFLQKEKLELSPATPFNPAAVRKTALAIRDYFRGQKHPNADVRILSANKGNTVRVAMRVLPGDKLEIGAVEFTGNHSIPSKKLRAEMKQARPAFFVMRWAGAARYIPQELDADLQRIRLHYKSKGFAAAAIGEPRVWTQSGGKNRRIRIEIPVVEGDRYRLTSIRMEGDPKFAAADVNAALGAVKAPQDYNYSILEETRQKIADALGRSGYALARVDLQEKPDSEKRTVEAIYSINAGAPVMVGRIDFKGNKRISEKFLRRELKISEGELFNSGKLDKSVERINKSKMVNAIARADVMLNMNDQTRMLDITFNVKEPDRQGIYATGGTSGGGYLGIIYTAFNFMHLGEKLSLQLDGGAAQKNMLLNIFGTHFLGSPFTIGLSVFNRYTKVNVANLVPGPDALVSVFRRHNAGIGMTGSYPLTMSLEAGLGFQVEKASIRDESVFSVASTRKSWRSEVAPSLVFDRTRGSGDATRGSRIAYGQAFNGSLFLKSLDSTTESLHVTHYMDDPFSHGRNSFAFRFKAGLARPTSGAPLSLERRFYPGDEVVRGFTQGSLSPWIAALNPDGAGHSLQPAGADTVIGFSTEYRVPIRGPVSSAAFFDLGWTHLNSGNATIFGGGSKLLEHTNGLWRASLGGELRVQLPIVNQSARFIFSWNPLRLNTFFQNPTSIIRLVEPKTSFRFALGTPY